MTSPTEKLTLLPRFTAKIQSEQETLGRFPPQRRPNGSISLFWSRARDAERSLASHDSSDLLYVYIRVHVVLASRILNHFTYNYRKHKLLNKNSHVNGFPKHQYLTIEIGYTSITINPWK